MGKVHVMGTLSGSVGVGAAHSERREEGIVGGVFNILPNFIRVLGLVEILWIKVACRAYNVLYSSVTRWVWDVALWRRMAGMMR